jgi:hypothetical protein
MWIYTSIPLYAFMAYCLVKHRDNFTFTTRKVHNPTGCHFCVSRFTHLRLQCTWCYFFIFYYWWGGTKSLGTAATSGLAWPQMIDEDDCGAIGGIKIGRGNRSTRRKSVPAPLCSPQIPHDQTRARTPGRRGGKPATNRLSYGVALYVFAYFPCFDKIKVGLCDLHAVCVSVYPHLSIFHWSNQSSWNLVYISWQLNPSRRRTT